MPIILIHFAKLALEGYNLSIVNEHSQWGQEGEQENNLLEDSKMGFIIRNKVNIKEYK